MNNVNILKGANVKLDGLSQYLSEAGVIVKPRIGRVRRRVQLPEELFQNNTEDDNEFYKEYINQGFISIIPKEDEKKLVSLESSVRSKRDKLAVACGNTYMTATVYTEDFLPYFNEKKVKYFEKRDEILSKWDILIQAFQLKLEAYLSRRGISDTRKSEIMTDVARAIPTKKEFEESFYMDVELSSFPVEANISILDKTLANQVKNSIASTKLKVVEDMLGKLLGTTFTRINDFLVYYKKNSIIHEQQIKPLSKLKSDIEKNNILAHPLINEIVEELSVIEKMPITNENDYDDIVEQAESILARTYGFLQDIGLPQYMDLSKATMNELEMSKLYLALNPNSTFASNMVANSYAV